MSEAEPRSNSSNSHPSGRPAGSPAPQTIGSYRLIGPIGTGGMGSVFRAVHEKSGHEVALKILPRSLARNPTLLQRFLREAKSVETLQHPNIVEIFDRGTEGGRYYLVLELLSGGDLHDYVKKHGPLSVEDASAAIKSAALGLQYAAEKGLIHRDIKPANLLRDSEGRVKVADLGLALRTAEEDERVTRDGTTVGTVDYMAPEQARDSRASSHRSDMYSLGCTFFYLLTGEPPFPGGSVPEKLRRHAFENPPDVRLLRPDVSEVLADLIRRMMAKKPDRRFVDYDHLIDALDEIRRKPPASVAPALSDESADLPPLPPHDDEDADLPFSLPTTPAGPHPLADLFDGDPAAGSGGFQLGPAGSGFAEPGSTRSHPAIPSPSGSSLGRSRPNDSGLSPAGPGDSGRRAGSAGGSSSTRRSPISPNGSGLGRPLPPDPRSPSIPPVDADRGGSMSASSTRDASLELRTGPRLLVRILRVALGLLLLAFTAIGVRELISLLPRLPVSGESRPATTDTVTPEGAGAVDGMHPDSGRALFQTQAPPWTEPTDPEPPAPKPRAFPPAELTALDLGSIDASIPAVGGPTTVVVERAPTVEDGAHADQLRIGFEARHGTVEIGDDGPFFVHDLLVHRRDRLIRAATGRRPIVVSEPTRLASIQKQGAWMVVDGCRVVVDGIDFVARVSDLPAGHRALFRVQRGGSLTLRDCTITLLADTNLSEAMAVVELGQAASLERDPMAVRFERTFVRTPGAVAARLAEGPGEVIVDRSLLLTGHAPAFAASGGKEHRRSLKVLGSGIGSSAALIELAGSAAGPGAKPIEVRAYGSVFARVQSGEGGALIVHRQPLGGGPGGPGVDWEGDRNSFAGWSSNPAAPEGSQVALADLTTLRAHFDGQEPGSFTSDAWPAEVAAAWVDPSDLFPLGPDVPQVVARPTPNLAAWTFGQFEPRSDELGSPEGSKARRITFEAGDPAWGGDLGRFLVAEAKKGGSHLEVDARGTGWHPMSPVRLPVGMGLTLKVSPPKSGNFEDRLILRQADGSGGVALLEVRGADLSIDGASFERDARTSLGHVIRVEGGRLVLSGCRITAPPTVEPGGGGLIEFRSEGTRPLPGGLRPTCTIRDSVLTGGGPAVEADLGAGVVALSNCAVASATDALVLRPQPVGRDRFAADLILDRCTLAAETNILRVGAWTGATSGPDRPWVVTSIASAFLDPFDHGGAPSAAVLLRSAPSTLAVGAIDWRSRGDAYHVRHYVVAGDDPPSVEAFGSDLDRWRDFWGPAKVAGSIPRDQAPHLAGEPIETGSVTPEDLRQLVGRPGTSAVGADLNALPLVGPPPG